MIKKSIKRTLLLLILVVIVLGLRAFFTVANLLPEADDSQFDEEKGRILLTAMGKAHGIEHWDDFQTYSVIFEDEFYGFIGRNSTPFKEDRTRFSLEYASNTYDGQLTLLSGEDEGIVWGLQSWNPYSVDNDGVPKFDDNANIYFWLPTYQYFIEFPKAIQSATAVAYIGDRKINGVNCQGILASWNTIEPQKSIDQYLVWIDAQTKRVVKLEYTVREMYSFLTGAASFNAYKEYNGILLPSVMPVTSNLVSDGLLHEMRILDFKTNTRTVESLRPDKQLPVQTDKPKE